MQKLMKRSVIALAGVAVTALAGCGGSSSDPGANPVESTGVFNLNVSDGPIKDAAKVCIKFDGVQLKQAGEEAPISIDFDAPEMVNLLANQGANSQPIASEQVPAGTYEWIRLMVDASRGTGAGSADSDPTSDTCLADDGSYLIRDSGELFNLFIPSGDQSGLKLIKDITIPANASGDFTAEWDLGKSFIAPPGLNPDVIMKPVVKIVSNNEVGTLVGQVDDPLVESESCDAEFAPSVYVFNDDVTPNPLDFPAEGEDDFVPDPDDAVATGLVERDEAAEGMPYRYSIGFLLAGNYEAAYTCDGETFVPVDGKPAEIITGGVTEVNFTVDDLPATSGS